MNDLGKLLVIVGGVMALAGAGLMLLGRTGIPLGRVGRPGEFADLAAYLLSDRSSYVTGSAINLDGGTSPVL